MAPTIPPDFQDDIEEIIDVLEEFGDQFQELIEFLSDPLAAF